MGEVLQVRVMAQTYKPESVERRWPTLSKLAWPAPSPAWPHKGVMELPEALFEQISLGEWPKDRQEILRGPVSGLLGIRGKLSSALADWKPQEADALSYQLEEALDELEKRAAEALLSE
ncbi:hypothetical protein PCS_01071 [Desulfocurvibacter africanus PCS]|uniref:Uncharacterized protein n=1 Tax=Desulfocurvibacter africanus PCS TaxID=1262666 RepID=M5PVL7_DESAF|nr:hypothetical protein [Desulfocurvibacter africanus]EMG38109.1 hypothetical protein PCS_01071 [Desulfocurvibacter africanus PCS]